MNSVATLLSFLCLTLVAACTRPSLPTVQHGQSNQRENHFDLQPPVSLNLGSLQCEPRGLLNLPEGACVGTSNAHPSMQDGTCTCLNEEYFPVPTKSGHTCVHLYSIFETLQSINGEIRRVGITDKASDKLTTLSALNDDFLLVQRILESSDIIDDVNERIAQKKTLAYIFENGNVSKETADAITVSVLGKDIRTIDRLLRENNNPKRIQRTLRYIQFTLEKIARVETNPDCVQLEKPLPRSKVLAHYPPIQP